MGKFTYTADNGTSYVIRADTSNAGVTGAAMVATTGRATLPRSIKPRHVWVIDNTDTTGGRTPSGRKRKLIVGTTAGTLFTGAVTTATLPDFGPTPSVAAVWNVQGIIGERRFAG
jgi:hypothetical protein